MGWLGLTGAVIAGTVFVPLTIDHIRDCKALKAAEREIRKLDRIEEIEQKYGVEITDEDLEMR